METEMKRLLPAYPIWLIDPHFSVWSRRERINETVPTFWTGLERPAYGFVRYNGVTYSFLGDSDDAVALHQDSISVSAFSTDCIFSSDEFTLKLRFISPLVPSNLDMLLVFDILPISLLLYFQTHSLFAPPYSHSFIKLGVICIFSSSSCSQSSKQ